MEELITYLQHFTRFAAPEIEIIRSKIAVLTIQKGDILPGPNASGALGFIREGILRVFYLDKKGNEVTEYFIDDSNLIMGAQDESGLSSASFRQALVKTELAFISSDGLEYLSAAIAGWDKIVGQLRNHVAMDRIDRIKPTLAGDATTCYNEFVDKYPRIAGRIPLGYLASYIGITQQSLSRIRRQLAKNTKPRK